MSKKQRMQTFIKIEKEWVEVDSRDVGVPESRLLVGKEGVYIVNVN